MVSQMHIHKHIFDSSAQYCFTVFLNKWINENDFFVYEREIPHFIITIRKQIATSTNFPQESEIHDVKNC